MSEIGTFYKKGSKSDYSGVEILGPSGVVPRAIIEKITFHDVLLVQGKKEKDRWTCKFQGIEKPMLLNSTCRKRLAKRFWNVIVEDGQPCAGRIDLLSGKGLAVRLDSEPCRDPSDGTMTIGLRISLLDPSPEEARPVKKKVVTEDKVQVTVNWAKENNMTFEDVEKKFDFASEEVKNAVQSGLNKEDLPA